MTNEKHAVDRTREELRQEIHAYKDELLAIADDLERQAVGQSRRCIYNPVQIAECGGPCEQIGPEACDCGALWVSQDAEQPVEPTDEELDEFAVFWWGSDTDERTVTDVIECCSMAAFARAVLAQWGHPTPQLVPVIERQQEVHPFVVRYYTNDERPSIKGNGFDGLEIGEDRQEAEEFIAWINKRICRTPEAQP